VGWSSRGRSKRGTPRGRPSRDQGARSMGTRPRPTVIRNRAEGAPGGRLPAPCACIPVLQKGCGCNVPLWVWTVKSPVANTRGLARQRRTLGFVPFRQALCAGKMCIPHATTALQLRSRVAGRARGEPAPDARDEAQRRAVLCLIARDASARAARRRGPTASPPPLVLIGHAASLTPY
jgi:hypothetical protein